MIDIIELHFVLLDKCGVFHRTNMAKYGIHKNPKIIHRKQVIQ